MHKVFFIPFQWIEIRLIDLWYLLSANCDFPWIIQRYGNPIHWGVFPLLVFSNLSVQSHFSWFQVFRVISFSFRCSKPFSSIQVFKALYFSLGIQSHRFQLRHLEPSLSIQAFRAIYFSLDVQSHLFQFRRSEPLHQLRHSKPFPQLRRDSCPVGVP